MMRAALRTSRVISSRRVIVRTIEPSWTSVNEHTSANAAPLAHSCTTSHKPNFNAEDAYSGGSTGNPLLFCVSPAATARSNVLAHASRKSGADSNSGALAFFSWNTSAESTAAAAAGETSVNTPAKMVSAPTSSSPVAISHATRPFSVTVRSASKYPICCSTDTRASKSGICCKFASDNECSRSPTRFTRRRRAARSARHASRFSRAACCGNGGTRDTSLVCSRHASTEAMSTSFRSLVGCSGAGNEQASFPQTRSSSASARDAAAANEAEGGSRDLSEPLPGVNVSPRSAFASTSTRAPVMASTSSASTAATTYDAPPETRRQGSPRGKECLPESSAE